MTSYRISSPPRAGFATPKKKTTNKKRSFRTQEKTKTTWADPTVPMSKISKSKLTKKQVTQLSCWSFG
jgi:hypothetical protein